MAVKVNYIVNNGTQSGGVVQLLAMLSGKPEAWIERRLQTGITPWDLAEELSVLGEFRDTLLERMLTQLCQMVREHQISQQDADDLIARFEMNVPVAESEYTH